MKKQNKHHIWVKWVDPFEDEVEKMDLHYTSWSAEPQKSLATDSTGNVVNQCFVTKISKFSIGQSKGGLGQENCLAVGPPRRRGLRGEEKNSYQKRLQRVETSGAEEDQGDLEGALSSHHGNW